MKTYFATSLHDDEATARAFMPVSSRPVPVYLAADLKPDARDGRCACTWSGDKLAVICLAHLTAARDFESDEGLVKVPRQLIERAMESCKVNNDGDAWRDLIALLDPNAFPDRAADVLATAK